VRSIQENVNHKSFF